MLINHGRVFKNSNQYTMAIYIHINYEHNVHIMCLFMYTYYLFPIFNFRY